MRGGDAWQGVLYDGAGCSPVVQNETARNRSNACPNKWLNVIAANIETPKTKREPFFLNAACIEKVHVVLEVTVCVKFSQPDIAQRDAIPARRIFENVDLAFKWVQSLRGKARSAQIREHPTFLLECDIGFLMLDVQGSRDVFKFIDDACIAMRGSRRLAHWRVGRSWSPVLQGAVVFSPYQLERFTSCKPRMEFYDHRSMVSKNRAIAFEWQPRLLGAPTGKMMKAAAILNAEYEGRAHQLSAQLLPERKAMPVAQAALVVPPAERTKAAVARGQAAMQPASSLAAADPAPATASTLPVSPLASANAAPTAAYRRPTAVTPAVPIESPLHWAEDEFIPLRLASNSALGATESEQLAMARVGQGLFRKRLQQIEKACRLTGLSAVKHLRASHIKPWRDSTDAERLDGNNGLLLSPHVDHLFDQGYLTFEADGRVVFSRTLERSVIRLWGLASVQSAGPFNRKQRHYLEYHRAHIFKNR